MQPRKGISGANGDLRAAVLQDQCGDPLLHPDPNSVAPEGKGRKELVIKQKNQGCVAVRKHAGGRNTKATEKAIWAPAYWRVREKEKQEWRAEL